MVQSSRMARSRLARMIGLVIGQLVVVMMLTVGAAWADVGTGSPGAAEGQSATQVRLSAEVARPSSGCVTSSYQTLARPMGIRRAFRWLKRRLRRVTTVPSSSARRPPISLRLHCCWRRRLKASPGHAWVAPGYADRVPTELASVVSADYCKEFVCETDRGPRLPAQLTSVPASPVIMLADLPGFPKHV